MNWIWTEAERERVKREAEESAEKKRRDDPDDQKDEK